MAEGHRLAARMDIRFGVPREQLAGLLKSVASGNQLALGELYDLTHRQVFALALRILKDRQLAEEVVLDVFMQVWRSATSFDPDRGGPLGWILTLARSRAVDALRSRTVRRRRETDLPPDAALVDMHGTPHESVSAIDRSRRVADAVAALPGDQACAVDMAYFQDLSHQEIAARLGLPLGTIKTRIRLGMLKLRDKLKLLEDER